RRRTAAGYGWCGDGCSHDLQIRHHAGVGVLEVMAVEDVLAAVPGEADLDLHPTLGHEHGVLDPDVLRVRRPAVAAQHPEAGQVQVHRVVRIGGQVPDLGAAKRHLGV